MASQPQTRRTPAGRYGTSRAPRAFYAVGGTLLVLLTVVVVILGRHAGTPGVSYGVRAFSTAERSVRITFEVHLPGNATATCLLRARDRLGAEVGRRQVTVDGSGGQGVIVRTETLTTSARPVTGEVKDCRLTG